MHRVPYGAAIFQSSVPSSLPFYIRSLSAPCPRHRLFASSFSILIRSRTRYLRRRCLAATCHRVYPRCATLRCAFVAPFFHPSKEASRLFFFRDHRRRPRRKIYLRFAASRPCIRPLRESGRLNERRDVRSTMNKSP